MKNALALVALALPASAQIPELQWARSPDSGWWFGFTPTATTWQQGEALGVANGGHLATIRSAAEDAWLGNVIATLGAFDTWIGLNDIATEGQFVWTSGLPVTHTAWGPGQPN